jgi:nucleoid-associated protein YgaU
MYPVVETAAEKAAREAKEKAAAATKTKLDLAAGARASAPAAAVRAGEKEVRAKLDAAVASARETAEAKAKEAAEAAEALMYTVKAGDTLGAIAKAKLGDAGRWTEIYELNKSAIGTDPNMIEAGALLKLPS